MLEKAYGERIGETIGTYQRLKSVFTVIKKWFCLLEHNKKLAFYCLRFRMKKTTPPMAIAPMNPPPTKTPFFAMKVGSSTFTIT